MIKIYSSERCRYCRELKGYLDKLSIPYQVLDVGKTKNTPRSFLTYQDRQVFPFLL